MDPGSKSNWNLEWSTNFRNLNKNTGKTNSPNFRASLLYCPVLYWACKVTDSEQNYILSCISFAFAKTSTPTIEKDETGPRIWQASEGWITFIVMNWVSGDDKNSSSVENVVCSASSLLRCWLDIDAIVLSPGVRAWALNVPCITQTQQLKPSSLWILVLLPWCL